MLASGISADFLCLLGDEAETPDPASQPPVICIASPGLPKCDTTFCEPCTRKPRLSFSLPPHTLIQAAYAESIFHLAFGEQMASRNRRALLHWPEVLCPLRRRNPGGRCDARDSRCQPDWTDCLD